MRVFSRAALKALFLLGRDDSHTSRIYCTIVNKCESNEHIEQTKIECLSSASTPVKEIRLLILYITVVRS